MKGEALSAGHAGRDLDSDLALGGVVAAGGPEFPPASLRPTPSRARRAWGSETSIGCA